VFVNVNAACGQRHWLPARTLVADKLSAEARCQWKKFQTSDIDILTMW